MQAVNSNRLKSPSSDACSAKFLKIEESTCAFVAISVFGAPATSFTKATVWVPAGTAVFVASVSVIPTMPLLTSFVQIAKGMRYNAMITGVDTQEDFEAALQAKADFISGAAIGAHAQLPVPHFHLSVDQIRGTQRQEAI